MTRLGTAGVQPYTAKIPGAGEAGYDTYISAVCHEMQFRDLDRGSAASEEMAFVYRNVQSSKLRPRLLDEIGGGHKRPVVGIKERHLRFEVVDSSESFSETQSCIDCPCVCLGKKKPNSVYRLAALFSHGF
jgi:hypothetical protein